MKLTSNIYVTKSFLPPLKSYIKLLKGIYKHGILTNQGPFVQELETKLKQFLDTKNLHFLSSGTVALQLALSVLDINEGEVITTPFSYVATTSSILWQRCKPIFVDIEKDNFTMDVSKIEAVITPKTKAIMAVHVFGYACNVEAIEKIATKHNLKVIYDGAHAFGVKYKGKSLLEYGDVSTLSFHATKLFHTVEGGACIVKDTEVSEKIGLQKRFGHHYDKHTCLGINAKASELHAAMGLANFPYIKRNIQRRKEISELYDKDLKSLIIRPKTQEGLEYNYAYYPVLLKSEDVLLRVVKALNEYGIFPRRYFYPSLNTLPYVQTQSCPVSEDIATRIVCLPLYPELRKKIIEKTCTLIKGEIYGTHTR